MLNYYLSRWRGIQVVCQKNYFTIVIVKNFDLNMSLSRHKYNNMSLIYLNQVLTEKCVDLSRNTFNGL